MNNTVEHFLKNKQTKQTVYADACFLPEHEKALLSKFFKRDNLTSVYTEFNKYGKLFVKKALTKASEELEELGEEAKDEKTFLESVLGLLVKCDDAGIDVINF